MLNIILNRAHVHLDDHNKYQTELMVKAMGYADVEREHEVGVHKLLRARGWFLRVLLFFVIIITTV